MSKFKLSRDTLVPLIYSGRPSLALRFEIIAALSQLLRDTSTLNMNNLFVYYFGYTELIREFPYNPVVWHNRALIFLEMGYYQLAYWDLERATKLLNTLRYEKKGSSEILASLTMLYFKYFPNMQEGLTTLITYVHYTSARNLISTDWGYAYIEDGVEYVSMAMRRIAQLPSNHPLQALRGKMQNLKELGEKKAKEVKRKYPARGEDDIYTCRMTTTDVSKLRNSRYPWDQYDTRAKAAKTKEGLAALRKEYNEVLKKLKADNVEVKLSAQKDTSKPMKTGPSKTEGLQAGLFAKKSIPKYTILFQEKPFLTSNNRLYTPRCEYCQTPSPPSSQPYHCSKCKEVFCSKKCFDIANAQYHKILCVRRDRLNKYYEMAQISESTSSLGILDVIKLMAMSLQMKIPLLELPGIRHLLPADMMLARVYNPVTEQYAEFLDIFDIEPKKWLDFDFWIFDTVFKIATNNSFGTCEETLGKLDRSKPSHSVIYEATSWLNHSCDPNCTSGDGYVTAIKHIKAGEELTISYTYENASKKERQIRLLKYGFVCKCKLCESEE